MAMQAARIIGSANKMSRGLSSQRHAFPLKIAIFPAERYPLTMLLCGNLEAIVFFLIDPFFTAFVDSS